MNKISLNEFNKLLNESNKINEVVSFEHCLISQKELEEDNIELICGHKFNYEPLLNEVKYQKLNHNPLESKRLKMFEIKCPYCRNIQDKLLPCYSEKIYGVNYPDKYCMKPFKCNYIFKSGKRKGETCNKDSIRRFCTKHKCGNTTENLCKQILVSGKNKGKECSCKIFQGDLCKRHYNINNK